MRKTILPRTLTGVMYVTGMRGIGKSFFAAQADIPDNILYLDFEEKGSALHEQLKFGAYHSVTALAAEKFGPEYTPAQVYPLVKQLVTAVPKDRFTVAVFDNIEPLEQAFLAEVKRNPSAYGISPQNAVSGSFGGAWPGVNSLVSGYANVLYAKGVQLIIAIGHLKSVWASQGVVPNKFRPKGVERWHELSILSLVLVPGKHVPVPAALVQKEQLGRLIFDAEKGEHRIVRTLPLRLPRATFAEVRRYLNEPANLATPAEGEVPTDAERAPYSDKFSKEQLNYIALLARIAAEEARAEDAASGA